MRPPVTRAGALKAREELVVLLRRKDGRGGVVFCCGFVRVEVLSFGLREMAMVDIGETAGADEAMLDFRPCKVGRLILVSFRTDGALACRVNVVGTIVLPFVDGVLSFDWFIFVMEFALSAFLRAGFFRGFLLGVVLEGCVLTAFAAVSVDAAMSIYLRGSVIL